MSVEEKLKSQFQYLECPYCSGASSMEDKTCSQCNGSAIVAWTGDLLLYWGKTISTPHLLQERAQKIVNNIINIILLIFGCFGIAMLIWQIAITARTGFNLWQHWNSQSAQMFIFWLSLISDSYLFFRFRQDFEKIKYIPKKYRKVPQADKQEISWDNIKDLRPEQKINIAELFSVSSMNAVYKSWELGKKYNHSQVAPIHLLVSLLTFAEIGNMFVRLSVSFESLKNKISRALVSYLKPTVTSISFSPDFKKSLFVAFYEAWMLQQKKVELTDLLVGVVKVSEKIREILYELKVDLNKIKNVALWAKISKTLRVERQRYSYRASLRPKSGINRSMTAIATPFLDSFSRDLTRLAQSGYLEPCIGRHKEIKEIFQAIEGGAIKSAILVGNPGIGKQTIINGIAQMMVAEDVPAILSDKRLVSLSIAKLISGVTAAEAQERLLMAINEIIRSRNIILYIDNISGMIGITPGGSGSTDLADVLAQSMSRGQVIVFATSTSQDYTRYIESKSALDEVMDRINIKEPEINDTIQILEAKSGPAEYKYNVFFSYDAIVKTVELSRRYVHDRFLPAKAIEIIEETAVRVSNEKGSGATVTEEDIAKTISEKTEIPVTEITQKESEKLLNLEAEIHKRMINQEDAVNMIAAALRRARVEIRDISRPIANFLFLGPTGVGKTELAKIVTEVYFGAEGRMIRLDMSEYQNKDSVSKLIGLSGGDEGGYLTERIRKSPFSLLLLDEIEKAHPDILNLFLQVMDDGRLTDATGRTIDFTNAIIIATSNAGAVLIQQMVKQGRSVAEIKEILMSEEINKYFRPEFLNRMDGVIIFKPLTRDNILDITKLMLDKVKANLKLRGVSLKATDEAINELADLGYDPQFGARSLRRVIQEQVSNSLANYILAGKLERRDKIILHPGGKVEIIKPKKH